MVLYGTKTWCHSGKLEDGASLSLPVGAVPKTKVATVTVSASDGKDINQSAQFLVGGQGRTIKVAGTDGTSTVDMAGKLCLVPGKRVSVLNRLGGPVDVVITVFWH